MKDTILKQHTYKTGSIKQLIECRSSETSEVLCYLVKFTDSIGISLCNMNFHYLNKALEWYKKLAINYNNERFMTKTGRLTLYALVCGYIENKSLGHTRIILKQLTDNTLVVHNSENQVCKYFRFNELTKARKFYDILT